MKKSQMLLALLCILFLAACEDSVDPAVDTLYFNAGHPDTLRNQAISKLYELYSTSDKSKEYYEVVSEQTGNYILNYSPSQNLLTVCFEIRSSWGGQYKNVNQPTLQKLANAKIKLDNLQQYISNDSTIKNNIPIIKVKTNSKIN